MDEQAEIKSFLYAQINRRMFNILFAQRVKSFGKRTELMYMACEMLHQIVSIVTVCSLLGYCVVLFLQSHLTLLCLTSISEQG